MTSAIDTVFSKIDSVVAEVTSAHAERVDREAAFPKETVEALGQAGLLGLVSSANVGGLGHGPREAALTVERIARACGSSAMVVCMHYAATAVIEKFGPENVRRDIVAGKHLSTLAFSEVGSRSHFWAPVSSATAAGADVVLNGKKSWITSANHVSSFVWSSRPMEGKELLSLWLVPQGTAGIRLSGGFDGLGLRGNDSTPAVAEDARIARTALLGEDGGGFSTLMDVVLPWFNVMNAACSIGLMEATVERTAKHASATRFEHAGSTLADLPTIRAYIARMSIKTDAARTLWLDTLSALENGRPDTMLRVLECKALANDAAIEVTDIGMRVCGGAAFRKDVGVERYFRDARAGAVMGPTSDVLYDFIGKAVCGLPVF